MTEPRFVLVPVEATKEMIEAYMAGAGLSAYLGSQPVWARCLAGLDAALAASPAVSQEAEAAFVEMVARSIYESTEPTEETFSTLGIPMPKIYLDAERWKWDRLSPLNKDFCIRQARAVLALVRPER